MYTSYIHILGREGSQRMGQQWKECLSHVKRTFKIRNIMTIIIRFIYIYARLDKKISYPIFVNSNA
jgi:hypothetical protein